MNWLSKSVEHVDIAPCGSINVPENGTTPLAMGYFWQKEDILVCFLYLFILFDRFVIFLFFFCFQTLFLIQNDRLDPCSWALVPCCIVSGRLCKIWELQVVCCWVEGFYLLGSGSSRHCHKALQSQSLPPRLLCKALLVSWTCETKRMWLPFPKIRLISHRHPLSPASPRTWPWCDLSKADVLDNAFVQWDFVWIVQLGWNFVQMRDAKIHGRVES